MPSALTSATRGCSHGFAGTGSNGKPEAPPPQPPFSVRSCLVRGLSNQRKKKEGGWGVATHPASTLRRRIHGRSPAALLPCSSPARPNGVENTTIGDTLPAARPPGPAVLLRMICPSPNQSPRPRPPPSARPRLLSFPRPGSWGFYRRTTTTLTTCSICSS